MSQQGRSIHAKLFGGVLVASSLGVVACSPNSATQVLTDTAWNMAEAERFGRMDIVIDQVAPSKRDDFAAAHAEWGGNIRIVDLEYSGMRVLDPAHADVMLNIAWQRLDDASLRSTTVRQKWFHGETQWVITGETRVSGDDGLLDEPDPKLDSKEAASAPPKQNTKRRKSSQNEQSPSDPALGMDTIGLGPREKP